MSVILGSAVKASQMRSWGRADIIEAFCTEGQQVHRPWDMAK